MGDHGQQDILRCLGDRRERDQACGNVSDVGSAAHTPGAIDPPTMASTPGGAPGAADAERISGSGPNACPVPYAAKIGDKVRTTAANPYDFRDRIGVVTLIHRPSGDVSVFMHDNAATLCIPAKLVATHLELDDGQTAPPTPSSRVDWGSMTAEEVLAAIHSRPVILGPWERWTHATGWSRHEQYPWGDGDRKYVSVQPSTPGPGWHVSGFDGLGKSRMSSDDDSARDLADHLATQRGWKLLSAPFTRKGEP